MGTIADLALSFARKCLGWEYAREEPAELTVRLDHPLGTIRVSQHPDGRWRCDRYGMRVSFSNTSYFLPGWITIVWPPGNEAGFDNEVAAVSAWVAYSERKRRPERIVFTPEGEEETPRGRS